MKQSSIVALVLSFCLCFLCFPPRIVEGTDLTGFYADSSSGFVFRSGSKHAGRKSFHFDWDEDTPPNDGYTAIINASLPIAITAWSNTISDDSTAPVVTIRYSGPLYDIYDQPLTSIWGQSRNERSPDGTTYHEYLSSIYLYPYAFYDIDSETPRSQYNIAGIIVHEIGHVYGLGENNGTHCLMKQGILWNTVPTPTNNELNAMLLLTDTHTHTTYSHNTYSETNHKRRCNSCKAFTYESHTNSSTWSSNSSQHWKNCSKCGEDINSTYANHNNLRYSFISHTRGHTKTCGTCSRNLGTFSHTYTYQQYTSAKHKYYCMYCSSASSNYRYQDHTIIYSGGVWRCQYCSYIEGTKRIKQSEALVAS